MRALFDRTTVAVFVALLIVPGILAAAGYARFDVPFITALENRRPFVAPPITRGALATAGWERDAEREIADAFPLRSEIIRAYDRFRFGKNCL